MIIKEAKYKNVMKKVRKCISDTIYGCDDCKSKINDYPNEVSRLEVTVFYKKEETKHLHFCSWACVINHLPKIKTDDFISLPFVYYNKRSGKELIKLITSKKSYKEQPPQ